MTTKISGGKSLADRLAEAQAQEDAKKSNTPAAHTEEDVKVGEAAGAVNRSPTEVQQVMKKYRLKKATVGVRCAKTGVSQQEYLGQWIEEGLRKEKKKLEK